MDARTPLAAVGIGIGTGIGVGVGVGVGVGMGVGVDVGVGVAYGTRSGYDLSCRQCGAHRPRPTASPSSSSDTVS